MLKRGETTELTKFMGCDVVTKLLRECIGEPERNRNVSDLVF